MFFFKQLHNYTAFSQFIQISIMNSSTFILSTQLQIDAWIPLSETPYSRTAATTLKNEGVRDRVWMHGREQRSGAPVGGAEKRL